MVMYDEPAKCNRSSRPQMYVSEGTVDACAAGSFMKNVVNSVTSKDTHNTFEPN